MDNMANVAMNGATRSRVITRLFTTPTARPAASPNRTPTTMPWSRIPIAETTLTRATVLPTDRSMPAVSSTNVCPNATQASAAAWSPTFWKLVVVMNTSDLNEKTTIIATTTRGRPT